MRKLEGKVAVITGAGRGLGRAYALRLASLGANLVVNDLHLDSAKEFEEELTAETVMAECEAFGVKSLGIEADVTRRDEVERIFSETMTVFGRADILVTNAGGVLRPWERGSAANCPEDDWRFILDVNLTSTVFCCQEAAKVMKLQRGGKIITVSSQAGVRASTKGEAAHYCVAKAGVAEYTRLLAAELGPFGITVNSIAPGLILTSRANKQFRRDTPEKVAEAVKDIPLKRMGVVEDCARVVEFFATDLSDYVTGQVLPVCGGMVLSPS